jgi:hypothetical protein
MMELGDRGRLCSGFCSPAACRVFRSRAGACEGRICENSRVLAGLLQASPRLPSCRRWLGDEIGSVGRWNGPLFRGPVDGRHSCRLEGMPRLSITFHRCLGNDWPRRGNNGGSGTQKLCFCLLFVPFQQNRGFAGGAGAWILLKSGNILVLGTRVTAPVESCDCPIAHTFLLPGRHRIDPGQFKEPKEPREPQTLFQRDLRLVPGSIAFRPSPPGKRRQLGSQG